MFIVKYPPVFFFASILRYAVFAMFFMVLVIGVWFNFTHPGSEYKVSTGVDDVFNVPTSSLEMPDDIPR